MNITIDKSPDALPPFEQISRQIIAAIQSNALTEEEALPSVRSLAKDLGLSPSTVNRAYSKLEEQGFIEAFAGKGFYVSSLKGDIETRSTTWKVFFSYARKDDDNTYGAVTKLKKAIINEYSYVTGNDIDIFQDKDCISWGDNWRKTIKENLGNTYFFIPILTPTYLKRPACLGELKSAFRIFRDTNNERGIFPIHFSDCTEALNSLNDDALADFLNNTNRIDWSELQYEEPSSSIYRRAVREIVNSMIKFDSSLESGIEHYEDWQNDEEDIISDDEMGLLDRIARIEDATASSIIELNTITESITEVGEIFSNVSISETAPFSKRLLLMKDLAKQLEKPADEIEVHTKEYSHLIGDLDSGVNAIIECAKIDQSSSLEDKVYFYNTMNQLNENTKIAFIQMKDFCTVLRNTEHLSKDLRKPIRRIRSSVEDLCSSQHYYREWENKSKKLIESNEID